MSEQSDDFNIVKLAKENGFIPTVYDDGECYADIETLKKFAEAYCAYATTESNKRIAELESIAAEQKLIIKVLKGECQDLGVTDIFVALGRKDTQISELQSDNNQLREALERIDDAAKGIAMSYIHKQSKEALSKSPAQSLIEHDNEILEQVAVHLNENFYGDAADEVRALKSEVK